MSYLSHEPEGPPQQEGPHPTSFRYRQNNCTARRTGPAWDAAWDVQCPSIEGVFSEEFRPASCETYACRSTPGTALVAGSRLLIMSPAELQDGYSKNAASYVIFGEWTPTVARPF